MRTRGVGSPLACGRGSFIPAPVVAREPLAISPVGDLGVYGRERLDHVPQARTGTLPCAAGASGAQQQSGIFQTFHDLNFSDHPPSKISASSPLDSVRGPVPSSAAEKSKPFTIDITSAIGPASFIFRK